MLQMSRVVALGLALLTVPMITFAQQDLTGDIVNRWIDSMDAVDEWGQDQEGIADALGEPEDPPDFQAIMQEAARQFPEIGAIIESHGFDGSEQWARSEEHTSELQSHAPISYAVFCLKKKK